MEALRRTRMVYSGLLFAWTLLLAWQVVEHLRVRQTVRTELINRAKDISSTVGIVLRSQRRFGGVISKDRIESALTALVRPGELNAVALLNNADQVVASAGERFDFAASPLSPAEVRWTDQNVSLMNLVDLGTNVTSEAMPPSPAIVLSASDMPFGTNRPPGPPPGGFDAGRRSRTNGPPDAMFGPPEPPSDGTNGPGRPRFRQRRGEGRGFDRPFWMSEEEYKSIIEKQGVHSFVLVLSTRLLQASTRQDLYLRGFICLLASVAAAGLAIAWRNVVRTSELEVRLARAAELNARLKEMNLAAAGLAHETRNPLNIIRGLAQMVSRLPEASEDIRGRTREIVDETDRVTAQLNEFINYSRPREVRRSPVSLESVLNEMRRALGSDLEDKRIELRAAGPLPVIAADEQLLRQALFNLLLNGTQAVEPGGTIEVGFERTTQGDGAIEVRDNGPGVPPEQRTEIFKPYVTTHAEGTGLGLAIVHQIILAHGWEIACLPNAPRGAVFRISHVKLATPG